MTGLPGSSAERAACLAGVAGRPSAHIAAGHHKLSPFIGARHRRSIKPLEDEPRMPAILESFDVWATWLGENGSTAAAAKGLLKTMEGVNWTAAPTGSHSRPVLRGQCELGSRTEGRRGLVCYQLDLPHSPQRRRSSPVSGIAP
jgi:hypothetical protein